MRSLTFGSLFAGIGGMDLGLERAGHVCRWQVEINPYCQRVLAKHWPGVPRFGDVREVGGGNLERVDLICGGFPCQDISNAGKRAGIDGERSGLWSEYARIIRELRPRFVLVENVSALLARGLGRVLGDLAASGYDAEWDCLPAAAVGAPHRRDRLFVVAHARRELGPLADADGCGLTGQPERNGGPETGEPAPLRGDALRCGADVADPDRSGLEGSGHAGAFGARQGDLVTWAAAHRGGWWSTEPAVGRVAHGIPSRVDRLRGLGNAVVPQVAEFIGRRLAEVA